MLQILTLNSFLTLRAARWFPITMHVLIVSLMLESTKIACFVETSSSCCTLHGVNTLQIKAKKAKVEKKKNWFLEYTHCNLQFFLVKNSGLSWNFNLLFFSPRGWLIGIDQICHQVKRIRNPNLSALSINNCQS